MRYSCVKCDTCAQNGCILERYWFTDNVITKQDHIKNQKWVHSTFEKATEKNFSDIYIGAAIVSHLIHLQTKWFYNLLYLVLIHYWKRNSQRKQILMTRLRPTGHSPENTWTYTPCLFHVIADNHKFWPLYILHSYQSSCKSCWPKYFGTHLDEMAQYLKHSKNSGDKIQNTFVRSSSPTARVVNEKLKSLIGKEV